MHARAVQALAVVLGDRLPVGVDVVDDPRAALELAAAGSAASAAARSPTCSCGGGASPERSSSTRPSTTASRTSCSEKHVGSKSVRPSVNGALLQRAVEAVGPRVVRALEAPQPALGRDRRAARRGAGRCSGTRAGARRRRRSRARSRRRCRPSGTARAPTPAPRDRRRSSHRRNKLARSHSRTVVVRIGRARQHRGLLERQARALDFRGVERKSGVRDRSSRQRPSEGRPDPTYHRLVRLATRSGKADCTASLDAGSRFRSASSAHPSLGRHVPTADSPPLRLRHLRLLGACVVMVVVAAFVPLAAGTASPVPPSPRASRSAIVCAALVSHLLYASSAATDDARLAWLSVGTTLALHRADHHAVRAPEPVPGRRPGRAERRRRRRALPDLARRADRRGRDRARRLGRRSSAPCSSSAAWVPSSSPGPPLPPPRSATSRRTTGSPPRCARSSRSS